jgi:phosphoribosylformimino-5-aminoimidazole carboxamide ribotide isomerase
MLIIPAIDLRGGRCVRLVQGRPEAETVYGTDPVEMARRWASGGAQWLHLVDLDGAFAGAPQQLDVVSRIAAAVDIPVQLGGGLRTLEQIREALAAGVARVILGTVAVTDPALVREACSTYGSDRILVGLDARNGMVAVKGWQDVTSRHILDVAAEIRECGVECLIFTDTARDGMLAGPNLGAIRDLAVQSGLRLIASGGMSCLSDVIRLRELEPLGVGGVILGKALYEGLIRLDEALAAAVGDSSSEIRRVKADETPAGKLHDSVTMRVNKE